VYDWIIEADIYRLRKAAEELTDTRQRRELEAMAERKAAVLTSQRQAPADEAANHA
jgi:hypothetical protein